MINPSVNGWIDKYFLEQKQENNHFLQDEILYYKNTRNTGFLIGYITSFYTPKPIDTTNWKSDEFSKVALLNTLFGIYQLVNKNNNKEEFTEKCISFYNELQPKNNSLLSKIMPQETNSSTLEKIISSRIKTNDNNISKNFSHILTNALLFLDVLAFRRYLLDNEIPEKYFKKSEEIIINILFLALNSKKNQTKYDNLLIKLFEASVRYSKINSPELTSLNSIDTDYFDTNFEKYYLIDLATLAFWNDGKIEISEQIFLNKLAEKLNIPEKFVTESILDINLYLNTYKNEIPYFKYSNPVQHLYNQTTENIQILLIRNKKRIQKEIVQSKELMQLLAQSSKRELNAEEKKKVRKQILDICKTIPSLTIFLVPGGSLLLPIVIKFFPKLLPSAFNENLE
jgi:hypothetical protein